MYEAASNNTLISYRTNPNFIPNYLTSHITSHKQQVSRIKQPTKSLCSYPMYTA